MRTQRGRAIVELLSQLEQPLLRAQTAGASGQITVGFNPIGLQGRHRWWGPAATAVHRAGQLWDLAKARLQRWEVSSAYRVLGRILHLLQDMTSPAHVHDDPHGKISPFNDWAGCASQDIDDFEIWGWCPESFFSSDPDEASGEHDHIRDYVSDLGVRTARLNATLLKLFDSAPQGIPGSLDVVQLGTDPNMASAFIRRLSKRVYDFTTFHVKLRDLSNSTDEQEVSELRRMLLGSTSADCGAFTFDQGLCEVPNGFQIASSSALANGPQDVGRTAGFCGRQEGFLAEDNSEEWWVMPALCTRIEERGPFGGLQSYTVDGFAYLENSGGEGTGSLGAADRFQPLRYGCTASNASFCKDDLGGAGDRSKVWFRQLYETNENGADNVLPCTRAPCPDPRPRKTTLRIYGDVLYTAAVAYSAGLIHTFIEEVNKPIADAGGPYVGEACQAIDLDASGSHDQQQSGSIVSYNWDFTHDGVVDLSTTSPLTQHGYPQPFVGQLSVRVTDNDGFTDSDTADVTVTPDVTPPTLSNITLSPNRLGPPNHKSVDVVVDPNAQDACGSTSCRIISVTSNEPVNGVGDGNTDTDWDLTGDLTLRLRAERSGSGAGREYTITVQCTDAAGNSAVRSVTMSVPHSANDGKPEAPSSRKAASGK